MLANGRTDDQGGGKKKSNQSNQFGMDTQFMNKSRFLIAIDQSTRGDDMRERGRRERLPTDGVT